MAERADDEADTEAIHTPSSVSGSGNTSYSTQATNGSPEDGQATLGSQALAPPRTSFQIWLTSSPLFCTAHPEFWFQR
jgi:hypothetical protein